MAEAPQIPSTDGEAPMPAWVYVVGGIVILAALLFVGMHFAGGGLPQH
jgi:hypothetical protein